MFTEITWQNVNLQLVKFAKSLADTFGTDNPGLGISSQASLGFIITVFYSEGFGTGGPVNI